MRVALVALGSVCGKEEQKDDKTEDLLSAWLSFRGARCKPELREIVSDGACASYPGRCGTGREQPKDTQD